jgi:hypothetical protein
MARSAEEAVLVAVMEGDDDRVDELLDDFMPHELRELYRQADELGDAVSRAMSRKGQGP